MNDLDSLIIPINTSNPCGIDVRFLPENAEGFIQYTLLKDTRNNLRRQERKNVEVDQNLIIEPQNWRQVSDLGISLLKKHTKDIEISAWLVESLVRLEGFKGLQKGLAILSSLVEKYGHNLYPTIEEDEDVDSKLASIAMLGGKYEIGTLIVPLYYYTIIPTNSGDDLNAWNIRQLLEKSSATEGDLRASTLQDCDEIKNAILDIVKDDFLIIVEDLASSKEAFNKFNGLLSQVFTRNAPNLGSLDKAIGYCCSITNSISEILQKRASASLKTQEKSQNEGSNKNTLKNSSDFSIDNLSSDQILREDAIKILEILVEFFRSSEPHSPISYSLERVAKWANLSLPQIINEMMNIQAMQEYSKITGVPLLTSNNNLKPSYDDDS